MANTILIKRGLEADIEKLELLPGELGVTLDSQKLYVGDANGNVTMVKASSAGAVESANKLTTARTIALTGDATGSTSFDGSANVNIAIALANSGVAAGTYTKVTVDAKGRVTTGASLEKADLPTITIEDVNGLSAEFQKYVTLAKHNTDYEALNTKIDNKDSLPTQSGNSGKFLTTNGTAASWVDVYTEAEIDNKISALNTTINGKASSSALSALETKVNTNTSSIGTINTALGTKANSEDVYTKTQTDNLLSAKATTAALNSAVEELEGDISTLNTNLGNKADKSTVYTTSQIDTKVNDLNTAIGKKATSATTLAGYGITDAYTKTEVDAKVASVYRYKGSVASESKLPTSGMVVGDVYDIQDTGMNVAWNGTAWDKLGISVDLTPYLTKESAAATYATTAAMNEALATKASTANVYSKTDIDGKISTINNNINAKANASSVYTKTEIDGKVSTINSAIDGKAAKATSLSGYGITNAYTKTETDNLLNAKLNGSSVIDGGEF
jgi:hypothetical protein